MYAKPITKFPFLLNPVAGPEDMQRIRALNRANFLSTSQLEHIETFLCAGGSEVLLLQSADRMPIRGIIIGTITGKGYYNIQWCWFDPGVPEMQHQVAALHLTQIPSGIYGR